MQWLSVALLELGDDIAEIPGPRSNPRVEQYHAAAGGASPDDVPWCSSFANFCMDAGRIAGTRSKAARSWLAWGRPLEVPRLGCVAVLSRGANPASGHVGFWVGARGGRVYLLGGNQGDRVDVCAFPAERVLGYRWPSTSEG